jgi:hypothetical protein
MGSICPEDTSQLACLGGTTPPRTGESGRTRFDGQDALTEALMYVKAGLPPRWSKSF